MKLKDLFNEQTVEALALAMQEQLSSFDGAVFAAHVFDDGWQDRELKQRMRHISTVLHDFLPQDYPAAVDLLRKALPSLVDQGFAKMVFPDYVEVYGLDDWDTSIPALEEFTQQISAEFAIRPFIVRYPDRTMARMLEWSCHGHPEVRRLASEGCRPRLPWGIALPALKDNPAPILPILEELKLDESESVRRSVANNLNDISKDNPEVVLDLLQEWRTYDEVEIEKITQHALRTLVKAGSPEALELLGYPSDPSIDVRCLVVEPTTIHIGESLLFGFDVESTGGSQQNLMIDFVVHLLRAKGQHTAKVFKLTKRTIEPGETLHIEKRVSFAPVTTRRYYPGVHAIEPKINGRLFERVEFTLQP